MVYNNFYGGRALSIAVGITMLGLLLVGGAGAGNSYEFVLNIPSFQQGYLGAPMGIALDSSGNVYFTDSYDNGIQKFDASGNYITKWGSYGSGDRYFFDPWGIAVDSSGNVYVVDSYNHRIQKFDASGNYITKWGSYGSGDGQFSYPRGIAVDSGGNVYVVDSWNHRIQMFDASGNYITKWGSYGSGDGQFSYPYGIAVDSGGDVYVVDLGNNRIQKFSASGGFIAQWGSIGSGDGQFYYPEGIAVDNGGNVYVADTCNHRVQKFSVSGGFIAQWGSYGSGDGQFSYPRGIAVDSSGDVYVVDTNNHRIQKFRNLEVSYLTFNGINGYVEIPDHKDLSIPTTGNLTISFWMRPDALDFSNTENSLEGKYIQFLGKGDFARNNQIEWLFRMYNKDSTRPNRIEFYVFNLKGGNGVGSYFQDTTNASEWINVVAKVDGKYTYIYKNGVLRDSDYYLNSIYPADGTAPVRIGTVTKNSYLKGALDDIIIYNRSLSNSEIKEIYIGTKPSNGIVAYWKADIGSGITLPDDSLRGHDGLFKGGVSWY